MNTRIRLLLMAIICLCLPALAHAQWETPSRAFHKSYGFPLDGKHLAVACTSCHLDGQYKGTPTKCADCHWVRRQDDIFRTRLGTSCEQCHKTTAWTAVTWNHLGQTGVALNAAHKTIGCESCHKDARFAATAVTCATCHAADYAATRTPDHKAAGFPTNCELCHKPSDNTFLQGRFDHNASFQLQGLHATATCANCHGNGVYHGTPRDCVGCHRTDYQKTTSPSHAAAGYSTSCETCHRATDATWRNGSFNHATIFPLVGQHATSTCTSCHINNVFAGTPRDCFGCHRTNFERTTSPNHAAAGYSTQCDTCHKPTDSSWTAATFNHTAIFPLVGVHATSTCASCHVNNVFKGTPRDCVGCHRTDYQKTTSPNHAAAGFPTTCESCHRPTDASWKGSAFNHSAVFALVGVHATTSCATCHVNNVYAGTPRTCVGCHQTDYQRTASPSHAAAGFSTTCDTCHRATDPSWTTAVFDHNAIFQLQGRHASAACTQCHVNNTYKGTPHDCLPCHQTDYQKTTNPNHIAAQFPTTCETCHKAADLSWNQGRFTHTWFPITSGRHAGIACSTCHTNPTNFTTFSCLTSCHGRTETDGHHKSISGYSYDSNRCYACHPTGRSG